jgi:pimeloyl-ACP methyl ester carboxylesterase
MRLCPSCNRGYEDDTLNFCLQDGTPLVGVYPGSEDPTQRLSRSTAETVILPTPPAADASQVSKPHPETHYAKSGNVNIAFQIVGEGPIDIVYVPGWVSHLEYAWESPLVANFYRRLASFSRLILFDKRGTGLSDQAANLPTLEQRMDDVRAVMEAADSARAVVFGMSEGGNMSMLFAATYPERTIALITFGVFAKRVWDPEYPWAPTPEQRQGFYDAIEKDWGGPIGIEDIAPSMAEDQNLRDWWAAYQRRSASPSAALALARMNTMIDVSNVLPAIHVPTLVLHRTGDRDANIEERPLPCRTDSGRETCGTSWNRSSDLCRRSE